MFFVKEAYFGKSKELLACEAQLHKFRTPYFGRSSFQNMAVNSDPELLKFSQMLGDFFGFGILSINVTMTNEINAFTLPVGIRLKGMLNAGRGIKLTTSGYKFKKELDYCCIIGIYSGLILNEKITDGEVMAVLLHEIGHNYFQELSDTNLILNNTFSLFNLVYNTIIYIVSDPFMAPYYIAGELIGKSDILQSLSAKINRTVNINFPFLKTVDTFLEYILLAIKKFIMDIAIAAACIIAPASLISKTLANFGAHLLFTPLSYIKYVNEKGADNFASMYGYGPETISIQQKFETVKSNQIDPEISFYICPPIYNYCMMIVTLCNLISGQLEEHPTTMIRCQDQIDMLEDSLKRGDYDPRLKKRLKEDIETCRHQMDAYQKIINDPTSNFNKNLANSPDLWNVAYNRIMETTFCGGLKEIIYKALGGNKSRFQQYSDKYNKLLRDVKIK